MTPKKEAATPATPTKGKAPQKVTPHKAGTTEKTARPYTLRRDMPSPADIIKGDKTTRSTLKAPGLVSLADNGRDVVTGTGSAVRDLSDKLKQTPKYQRLSHSGREGKVTEEQPDAQRERKQLKAKVAVAKNIAETEDEFLQEELEESQQVL